MLLELNEPKSTAPWVRWCHAWHRRRVRTTLHPACASGRRYLLVASTRRLEVIAHVNQCMHALGRTYDHWFHSYSAPGSTAFSGSGIDTGASGPDAGSPALPCGPARGKTLIAAFNTLRAPRLLLLSSSVLDQQPPPDISSRRLAALQAAARSCCG
jgi:hypothetical protein